MCNGHAHWRENKIISLRSFSAVSTSRMQVHCEGVFWFVGWVCCGITRSFVRSFLSTAVAWTLVRCALHGGTIGRLRKYCKLIYAVDIRLIK